MIIDSQTANSRDRFVAFDHSEHEPIQNDNDDTIIPEIGDTQTHTVHVSAATAVAINFSSEQM